jgi:SRSO17 transposase
VGALAPAELAPIRGRLEAFADDVFASLPRTDQRARGQCYLRGLMLDGRRKSIEPMAARLGEVHYQALHHFVATSPWDRRLFLPERWDEDAMAERRAACHLPAAVHHRPKWQLVLDMLDELAAWGLRPPVLGADCGYGEVGEFRWGLDAREIDYVVEVRSDTSAYAEQVRPTTAAYTGRGRRPRSRYQEAPCSLAQLALQAGQQACVDLIWRRGSKGLQRGRFLALRVRPAGVTPRRQPRADGGELPTRWLLVEWPKGKATPVKYWLSNLPQTTPLVELVRLARLRWRVEQDYRECKGALGLDHFEGRGWPGWHHHVTLVSVAHGFLVLERLRSPNLVASA